MAETLVHWQPTAGMSKKYDIDSVNDGRDGRFTVVLTASDSTPHTLLVTCHSVYAYRYTDESFAVSLITAIDAQYGGEFYGQRTFFQVIDSLYIQQVCAQSYGFGKSFAFKHFLLIAGNALLDIITTQEPVVKIAPPD